MAMPSGPEPKKQRSGGSSASTISSTAAADAVGSPSVPTRLRRCSCTYLWKSAYAGSGSDVLDEEPLCLLRSRFGPRLI
ncbi:hypothetical protein OG217_37685 (plasmid) [Streptomyces sp. NBC_01023]|nr:hypothetical protein OG217_37685 [Streptomyces sp. NBC_01023]